MRYPPIARSAAAAMGLVLAALPGPSALAAAAEDQARSLETMVKNYDRIDGLFTLYRSKEDGTLLLAIRADQLGRQFIYSAYTENSAIEAGHFRGEQLSDQVIHLERNYKSISFIADNTRFYFDPKNALSRAKDANITHAILAAAPIEATSADGKTFLVGADPLFLTEVLQQVRPTTNPYLPPGARFELGRISYAKTHYNAIKNYPQNTDLTVDYAFDNAAPLNPGDDDVTDPRYVTVRIHHSLIAPPPSDFEPRADDFRVGFLTERRTDLTSASAAPYKDVIDRWNLKKKDSKAALSEPVKPLIFWIENTTPTEFRDTIKAAVLAWNPAFEKAGFKNALDVRVQPDDALWDAGDIRYNVIRWTSSPDPLFGGYGPSVTDPRTGEIISADIMLEYVFVTNRVKQEELYSGAALAPLQDEKAGAAGLDERRCTYAHFLQHETMLGIAALKARGASEIEITRLIKESLMRLVLHEVGHTLGLSHNLRASSIRPFAELQGAGPLAGSVMDYVPLNIARQGQKQGAYYDQAPGPYDMWAIEVGYAPPIADPAAEAARAGALVARSTEPALAFANDADDMRVPGKGIDPRVQLGDLSSDSVAWADDRFALVDETMASLRRKFPKPGESYQSLRLAYLILSYEQLNAAEIASRQLGGVLVERSVAGQPGAKIPYTPVAEATQKRALGVLARRVFAPDALAVSRELAAYLGIQRRGYDLFYTTEDPKFHDRALFIQDRVLAHLLHPRVLLRLTDTSIYGNTYSVKAFLSDLTAAIFAADAATEINSFRRPLQVDYVERLAHIAADPFYSRAYDPGGRASVYAELEAINALNAPRLFFPLGGETEAHRAYLRHLIAVALNRKE
jgi:hypothetical protein